MKKLLIALVAAFGLSTAAYAGNYAGVPYITTPVEVSQLNAYLNAFASSVNQNTTGLAYAAPSAVTATAAATTQTLATYSLPAGWLTYPGQSLRIKGVYTKAANADSVTPVLTFGTFTYTGAANTTSAGAEEVECTVTKSGASTQNIVCTGISQTTPIVYTYSTGTSTDTAAIVINAQCTQGSAAADCILASFTVESLR